MKLYMPPMPYSNEHIEEERYLAHCEAIARILTSSKPNSVVEHRIEMYLEMVGENNDK